MPTIRTEFPEEANVEAITKDLDTTYELWEEATVRIASYHQRLANLHNQRVNPCTFRAEELVLKKVFENTANPANGKFEANWEVTIHGGSSRDSRVLCVEQTRRNCYSQDVECHAS